MPSQNQGHDGRRRDDGRTTFRRQSFPQAPRDDTAVLFRPKAENFATTFLEEYSRYLHSNHRIPTRPMMSRGIRISSLD